MPANECTPFKSPGTALTMKATAAVTGKRFVKVTANRTGGGAGGLSSDLANVYQGHNTDTQGESAVGVAKNDAANGSLVGFHSQPGIVVPVTAGANIAAGQDVMTDNQGRAIPYAAAGALPDNRRLGVAMTGSASGADAEIKLY